MKNAKEARMKKEFLRILRKWQPKLFLQGWFFEVHFHYGSVKEQGDMHVLAEISVDTAYLKAHIHVYDAWFRAQKDIREHAIVHELCHCHTQDAWDNAGKLRDGFLVTDMELRNTIERLTQRISYIAMANQWRKQ